MNPQKIAKDIYALVGPKENILRAENCMTRLRLVLKDKNNLDLTALSQVSGVLGLHDAGDELQIILGPGRVIQVHKAFVEIDQFEYLLAIFQLQLDIAGNDICNASGLLDIAEPADHFTI